MRRLATQSRGGSVGSSRDYQTIQELGKPLCFSPQQVGDASVSVKFEDEKGTGQIGGMGGYFAADPTVEVKIEVRDPENAVAAVQTLTVEGQRHWTRGGFAWALAAGAPPHWTMTLRWHGPARLIVWGLACGSLELPQAIQGVIDQQGWDQVLRPVHLPEALYLPHAGPLSGGVIIASENIETTEIDRKTPGKKCSQCQRLLPIDPRLAAHRATTTTKTRSPQSMVIAFHGHASKRTGYQNECRACKKFEINDHFNPIRTSDQHHESSNLMRERKLLLRDGDIVERFKERGTKEGFRTFIWKRFGGKCFKCGKAVTVEDYQLDHTRPLAYLWPLDEHATCLCSDCNNNKKDAFPVEFYSLEDLKRLSGIVMLPLEALQQRAVNEEELQRIRSDIIGFARSWDARLFDSVASRVQDVHPEIDLYEELQTASPSLHAEIAENLRTRPPALRDDEGDLEEGEEE